MQRLSSISGFLPTVFGSILGANILTMSTMNFFESPTKYIAVIYATFMLLMIILLRQCRFEYPLLTKREHLFCVAFALILFLPRFPYLVEGLLGYAVIPIGDDPFHIPDL